MPGLLATASSTDRREDCLNIPFYILVAEADHAVALVLKLLGLLGIALAL